MKLGSKTTDPLTGVSGFVTRFVGQWAICRAEDGSTFRVQAVKPPKPLPPRPERTTCLIRIHGVAAPLVGVVVAKAPILRARVTQKHPVWYGCEVTKADAEITLLNEHPRDGAASGEGRNSPVRGKCRSA